MPWPMTLRYAAMGAPAGMRVSLIVRCSRGDELETALTHREVHPGEAEVELATEEGDRIGLLRGQLLEQLAAEVEDGGFVGLGRGGVERGHAGDGT